VQRVHIEAAPNNTQSSSGSIPTVANILFTYQYDGFGNLINPFDSTGGVIQGSNNQTCQAYEDWNNNLEQNTNPFRFAGEYYDWSTGTYYLRARHFNPRTGRFTQADPFWGIHNMQAGTASILQSGNLFAYTMNNPVMWNDPSGEVASTAIPGILPKVPPEILDEAMKVIVWFFLTLGILYADDITATDMPAARAANTSDVFPQHATASTSLKAAGVGVVNHPSGVRGNNQGITLNASMSGYTAIPIAIGILKYLIGDSDTTIFVEVNLISDPNGLGWDMQFGRLMTFEQALEHVKRIGDDDHTQGVITLQRSDAQNLAKELGGILMTHTIRNPLSLNVELPHFHPRNHPSAHIWFLKPN